MSAPFYHILSKCDRALVAYIVSQGAGTPLDTFPMKRSEDKTLPITQVWSRHAKPEGNHYSGTYLVQAIVIVRTLGIAEQDTDNAIEAPASASDQRVGATFDAFHVFGDDAQAGDQLADAVTAAARASAVSPRDGDLKDFTIQSVKVEEMDAGFEAKGDGWSDVIHLEILCNVGDVSG